MSSEKFEKLGFQFQFTNLEQALRNCLTKIIVKHNKAEYSRFWIFYFVL
ncbi:hypothetical protein [Flavobacterium sp. ZB4R12]